MCNEIWPWRALRNRSDYEEFTIHSKSLDSIRDWRDRLVRAVNVKDEEKLKYLLNDITTADSEKNPLLVTTAKGDEDLFQDIICIIRKTEYFSNCELADIFIKIKLVPFFLIKWSYINLMELMLERGYSPNDMCSKEKRLTIFNWMVSYNSHPNGKLETLMELFIHHGADLQTEDSNGNTPLHNSLEFYERVFILLRAGAKVNSVNRDGQTPLLKAIRSTATECVIYLLLRHGGVLKPDKGCKHSMRHLSPARVLPQAIDHIAYCDLDDIDEKIDEDGNTLLHHAMKLCNIKFSINLLDRGANINSTNRYGCSPLYLALEYLANDCINNVYRKFEISNVIELCFDNGLNLNWTNSKGFTIFQATHEFSHLAFESLYQNIYVDPILKGYAIAETKGYHINEADLDILHNGWPCSDYNKYKTELLKLKAKKVYDNITLSDMLTIPFDEVVCYMKNNYLIKAFEACDLDKFPHYSQWLKNRFYRAKCKLALINKTTEKLAEVLKNKVSEQDVLSNIIFYLNERDMQIISS